MASKFPFPFFGQGDAGYYEWFEMWVWFVDPVPKAKRAALVKMAPKLCRLDALWPNGQLLWPSTGDQWIEEGSDGEAGGTKLGAWHKASVKMYASVEPALLAVVPKIKKDDDLRRSPITIISHYVAAAMKPAIRKLVVDDE